jgi:DNA-binding winged helix-turn-helix (wHTH) protein
LVFAIAFGTFCLLPAQRLLLNGDQPVCLGSRALELLIALLEQPGEVVTKESLMRRVWPNTFVGPANLTVHISALGRALAQTQGDSRFLITIPGHGYQFVAPVKTYKAAETSQRPRVERRANCDLPVSVDRLSGRRETVNRFAGHFDHRLLAVALPGGIRNTIVTLSLAKQLVESKEYRIDFVDLEGVCDASEAHEALDALLEFERHDEAPQCSIRRRRQREGEVFSFRIVSKTRSRRRSS